MVSTDYIITAEQGLHARPAAALVKFCRGFKSSVQLKKADRTVLLNSMLNLLSLAIKKGDTVTIMIEGEDESSAMLAIDSFFKEQLKHL
ncbi:MAG: HPr family phosphocarrier protein [Bacteroidota bacterium]